MTHAYSELYLEDAMSSLGAMLDYAVGVLNEDLGLFYDRFLVSGIADEIAIGNPKYLGGMSGVELALTVARRTGKEVVEKEATVYPGREYWTGWTLAYLQWYFNLSFQVLHAKGVTAESICARYAPLHEADMSKSVQVARAIIQEHEKGQNPFKKARKNARLTQRELAERSGVSLRALRAYEQAHIVGGHASAQGMYNISRVLGCPMDYLLSGTETSIPR